jgi:hypothetical protein
MTHWSHVYSLSIAQVRMIRLFSLESYSPLSYVPLTTGHALRLFLTYAECPISAELLLYDSCHICRIRKKGTHCYGMV